MRRVALGLICGAVAISIVGCARLHRIIQPAKVDTTAATTQLLSYSGPRVRIAVADFEVKATKATGEIGSGLREMLITAMVNSNRFLVAERQAVTALTEKQELAADLIVTAAVTEFEPQSSGGSAGVGGGGGMGSGILGGLLGAALNKAYMALDIRIINTATSEVLGATRVQGQASDIAGGFTAGLFGSHGLVGGLSAYANTPMEKAIRICIIEALRYISQTIPANYYKD